MSECEPLVLGKRPDDAVDFFEFLGGGAPPDPSTFPAGTCVIEYVWIKVASTL